MNRAVYALVVVAVSFVSLAAGSALGAGGAWRVFAKGSDTSDYYASATASADAPKSKALAIRAVSSSGKPVKVTFSLFCNGEASVRSGVVTVLTVAAAKKCTVSGYASQDGGGTLRVELLRR